MQGGGGGFGLDRDAGPIRRDLVQFGDDPCEQALVDVVGETGVELGAVTTHQMNGRRHRRQRPQHAERAPGNQGHGGVGKVGERRQCCGGVGQHAGIGRIADDRRESAVEVARDQQSGSPGDRVERALQVGREHA